MFVNMLIDTYVLWVIVFISATKFYPMIQLFKYLAIILLLNTLKPSMKKLNLVTAFFYLQVV